MKNKILFTDVDNTLVTRDKIIRPKTLAAIEKLLDDGGKFCFATGRARTALTALAETYGLKRKGVYAMLFNGAITMDFYTGEILTKKGLDPETVRIFLDEAAKFDIHGQTYDDTYVVTERQDYDLDYYCRLVKMEYRLVKDAALDPMAKHYKCIACDYRTPERLVPFKAHIEKVLEGRADIFFSAENALEVVAKGVNKGSALVSFSNYLGIPVSETVASGDGENDITLIAAAGTGCAVANAIAECRAAADYITEADCDNDAVAEIIEKFFYEKC